MRVKQVVKWMILFVLLVWVVCVMGRSFLNEFYDNVIDEKPGRTSPPEGYQAGQCAMMPGYYDWTRGEVVRVDNTLSGLRWAKNPKVGACIPNDWEPSTIPKLLKTMENPQFQ